MILPIYGYGEPVLRKVCEDISQEYPNLKETIANMYDTMYHAHGVGLAAPQVGLPICLFIVDTEPFSDSDDVSKEEATLMKDFKKTFINAKIIKDFCYWNLTLFLQSRNPNVPDIPNKLKRPEKRGSLSKHKTQFWDIVIRELNGVNCIYTGKPMKKGEYAVEHFIPFQFVAPFSLRIQGLSLLPVFLGYIDHRS